jgi:hypothetical protein
MLNDTEVLASPFVKALRWRVYDPEEAFWIAASHRFHAAEARSAVPQSIECYRDQCLAANLESRAEVHEQLAAICEQHASRLRYGADEKEFLA